MKQTTEKVAQKLSAFVSTLKAQEQQHGLTIRKKSCSFGVYPQLGSAAATAGLCRDLARFIHDHKEGKAKSPTFMAVFTTPAKLSEEAFNEKVQELTALMRKAAEPFYCTPESAKEQDLHEDHSVFFAGRMLKVVSIYRNTSQGHLKFDYPMLAFCVQQQDGSENKKQPGSIKNPVRATDSFSKMAGSYGNEKVKA
ncbi:YqcI/YcgG family protein [Cesiribacter sp. SM1]|uniref:YqcI/YcgG family protein n=1 Tax=Cesiribacter sp. SM1 TaxID=2861196 RepID=UPI001CD749B0|nr:YqcI/YcgG family protein [Cesiribacter sp. SM1]